MNGTKKYCPYCDEITHCKALPTTGKNFYMIKNKDIKFFQRQLKCLKCEKEFTTDEIYHEFIMELELLRVLNKELREKIVELENRKVIVSPPANISNLEKQRDYLVDKVTLLDQFRIKFLELQQALKVIKKYG